MNYDVDKYITKLTVMELKAIIKECLREILAEEKQFSDVEYKALWLKSPPNPPPIETETMPPQCQKQPVLHKVLNARPIETETMPKPTTYAFCGPPWRYSKPEG